MEATTTTPTTFTRDIACPDGQTRPGRTAEVNGHRIDLYLWAAAPAVVWMIDGRHGSVVKASAVAPERAWDRALGLATKAASR